MKLLSVNFHYIRNEQYQQGIYPRNLDQLIEQIDIISKYFTFISQNELAEKIRNENYDNKNYCLLTFDDGLKEQMEAFSILNKKGVPAVFYISTYPLRELKALDVHKLHYLRSQMDDKDIFQFIESKIDKSIIQYPENLNQLYRYDELEAKKLKYLLNFILKEDMKVTLINELFNNVMSEVEFVRKLYMDKSNIKTLADIGCLGTHCDAHLPLATLNDDEIEADIVRSLNFLKNDCSIQEIRSISYPFGGAKAVSKKVIDISTKLGFDFGLTMSRGINSVDDLKSPLSLKRIDTNDAPGGKLNSKEFCI